jgi:hypothetical protein
MATSTEHLAQSLLVRYNNKLHTITVPEMNTVFLFSCVLVWCSLFGLFVCLFGFFFPPSADPKLLKEALLEMKTLRDIIPRIRTQLGIDTASQVELSNRRGKPMELGRKIGDLDDDELPLTVTVPSSRSLLTVNSFCYRTAPVFDNDAV